MSCPSPHVLSQSMSRGLGQTFGPKSTPLQANPNFENFPSVCPKFVPGPRDRHHGPQCPPLDPWPISSSTSPSPVNSRLGHLDTRDQGVPIHGWSTPPNTGGPYTRTIFSNQSITYFPEYFPKFAHCIPLNHPQLSAKWLSTPTKGLRWASSRPWSTFMLVRTAQNTIKRIFLYVEERKIEKFSKFSTGVKNAS